MYTIVEMMNNEIKKPKESQKRDVLERINYSQNHSLTKSYTRKVIINVL